MQDASIILLTDFGTTDPYVGQMHMVLSTLAPKSRVIDLCHNVSPQAVTQAGFMLASSADYLPPESVTLCVVDPGVGTTRDIVALQWSNCSKFCFTVLAPDNGLLTLLIRKLKNSHNYLHSLKTYRLQTDFASSATFHGRDIFCPLAAKLIHGASLSELGEQIAVDELVQSPLPVPKFFDVLPVDPPHSSQRKSTQSKCIQAHILHIDHFGNCLTTLDIHRWKEIVWQGSQWEITAGKTDSLIAIPVVTYEQVPATLNSDAQPPNYQGPKTAPLGLIAGSQGYLELAVNCGSAQNLLKCSVGTPITMSSPPHLF